MLQNSVSKSLYKRLPIYLDYCLDLKEKENAMYVSSKRIADDLYLGEVQVRKDLASVCTSGRPKIGYKLDILIDGITKYINCHILKKAVLVGAGKLGKALLGFDEIRKYGLEITAAFDVNDMEEECNIPIYQFNDQNIESVMNKKKIDVAILCVPKNVAQSVCNKLIDKGIKVFWNFAPIRLNVPNDIIIQNENLAYSASLISSLIK